jgi:hypothetical protein
VQDYFSDAKPFHQNLFIQEAYRFLQSLRCRFRLSHAHGGHSVPYRSRLSRRRINQVGKFLEIRHANAHAWAEVWLDGRGWVRVDPTTVILPSRVAREVSVAGQVESDAISLTPLPAPQIPGLFQFEQLLNSVDF